MSLHRSPAPFPIAALPLAGSQTVPPHTSTAAPARAAAPSAPGRRCAGRHRAPVTAKRLGAHPLAEDRGDVPGWVMITLMTAAIVIALWAVASDQIVQIFEKAMEPFLNRQI